MGAVAAALIATYLLARLVARLRGIDLGQSSLLTVLSMAATAVTYLLVYWWHYASTEGKGDAPGALLLFAFGPGLAAFIGWSLLLGRRGDR